MTFLDQKALESATDAALSRFNDDTAPRRCENWRAHLREMTSDAIRTYLSASLPADAAELVERLRGPLAISGEHRDAAAFLIQSQAVRIAELERAASASLKDQRK